MPAPANKRKNIPVALVKGRFCGQQQASVPNREIVDPLPVVHRGVSVSARLVVDSETNTQGLIHGDISNCMFLLPHSTIILSKMLLVVHRLFLTVSAVDDCACNNSIPPLFCIFFIFRTVRGISLSVF